MVKPTVGVLDITTKTMQGVSNEFHEKDLERFRFPRYFGKDGLLEPYNHLKSKIQFILYTLEEGKYFHETYIFSIEINSKLYILTNYRILCIIQSMIVFFSLLIFFYN